MDGFYGRWADLNGDGEVDDFEKLIEMEIMTSDSGSAFESEEPDEEKELVSEIEMAGLDYDELSWMDEEERREILEDAGLDPDDFDF